MFHISDGLTTSWRLLGMNIDEYVDVTSIMSVFPDTFKANMTFPYDSFNVEELHTVDKGQAPFPPVRRFFETSRPRPS
jgi:hypothetical protein